MNDLKPHYKSMTTPLRQNPKIASMQRNKSKKDYINKGILFHLSYRPCWNCQSFDFVIELLEKY